MKTPNAMSQDVWYFEYLSILASCAWVRKGILARIGVTNSQKDVNHVHEAEDQISSLRPVITVAPEHEEAGHDMVREHLPMIFPPLLDIDDYYLLQPEAELYQIIPLHRTVNLSGGPAGPEFLIIHPVLVVVHDILVMCQSVCRHVARADVLPFPTSKR